MPRVYTTGESHPGSKYPWEEICDKYYKHKMTPRQICDWYGIKDTSFITYQILRRDYAEEWARKNGFTPYSERFKHVARDDICYNLLLYKIYRKKMTLEQINAEMDWNLTQQEFDLILETESAKRWLRYRGLKP